MERQNLLNLRQLLISGQLAEFQFVGAYIILWSQHLHSYIVGPRRKKSAPRLNFENQRVCFCCHRFHQHTFPSFCNQSHEARFCIYDIPGVAFSENEKERLGLNPSIKDVFAEFMLKNVPEFVNDSIVSWSLGQRPFIIRFDMPSPLEVLNMMKRGSRCLSVFLDDDDVTALKFKDDYPPFKERNALEFLYHDLQHMERFIESYEEQIGFLSLFPFPDMLKLPEMSGDPEFEQDIVHLLSDMNAPSLLLLKFFRSKWMLKICRFLGKSRLDDDEYHRFLHDTFAKRFLQWAGNLELANVIVKPSFQKEDARLLKTFFMEIGCRQLEGL